MPRNYILRTDLSVKPVQHAHRKVPIELQAKIEENVKRWLTRPYHTWDQTNRMGQQPRYPQKPDRALCICLDLCDVNKVILSEYYNLSILDGTSHKLSKSIFFFEVRYQEWILKHSPRWAKLAPNNIQKPYRQVQVSQNALWPKDEPGCLPNEDW